MQIKYFLASYIATIELLLRRSLQDSVILLNICEE
jgi:hypothetical protein